MSALLVVLVLVVAVAGGFLGDLLELAGLLIVVLAVMGALAGAALWFLLKRLLAR